MKKEMSSPIVIPVVPKYVIAKSAKSASAASPMDEFLQFKGVDGGQNGASRKRKLDHLSPEEKVQRKKLKNRVAAQTSRDRKKAKMEDMELRIATQDDEISHLRDTCTTLRKERDELRTLYTKLERRFVDMERKLAEQDKQLKEAKLDADIASRVIGSVTNTCNGSAVSTYPLPQGLVAQSIARNVKRHSRDQISALLRIIALCVAWKSASTSSTAGSLRSWPTASLEILQPKLKEMLRQKMAAFQDPLIPQQWEPQPMASPIDQILL
jgi:uncharacterized coiled-coil protein SlyX